MIRIIVFIFIFLSFNSCGFQPMYKSDGKGIKLDRLSINFKGDITYEIKEELKSLLSTEQQNKDYIVMVEVKEEMVPVIINENGTVSKYQIDIFKVLLLIFLLPNIKTLENIVIKIK